VTAFSQDGKAGEVNASVFAFSPGAFSASFLWASRG
jgi:hypothetical protein